MKTNTPKQRVIKHHPKAVADSFGGKWMIAGAGLKIAQATELSKTAQEAWRKADDELHRPEPGQETHRHKCEFCGHIWEHGKDCAGIDKAHECAKCKRKTWRKYWGSDKPKNPPRLCAVSPRRTHPMGILGALMGL